MSEQYAAWQLASAFVTALTSEDPATRERANRRVAAWQRTLAAMGDGSVRVGSRTPVRGLPSWVTLEVLRGGFATGAALAESPLGDDEIARVADLPRAGRAEVFASYLTDAGVAELGRVLDSGAYSVEVPEDAALLAVAWLLRVGDRDGALEVLEAIGPLSGRLRFAPRPRAGDVPSPGQVWRITAGDARAVLEQRSDNPRVERQRSVLTQWLPVSDNLAALWESTRDTTGAVGARWDDNHRERARRAIEAYDELVISSEVVPRRFIRAGENVPVLVEATRTRLEAPLESEQLGRVAHVLERMARARGSVGSGQHASIRASQARAAAAPSHRAVAQVAAARLASAPQHAGLTWAPPFLVAVTAEEVASSAVPAGTSMPESVRRIVTRAQAGTVDELVRMRVIPSAEVLAELTPAVTAGQVASMFDDAAIGELMAATYTAFRRRRTLLLRNLSAQVRFEELPWVAAVQGHAAQQVTDATGLADPHSVANRLSELVVTGFPDSIVPNAMVSELSTLFAAGGAVVPLTGELAADIFEGRFSRGFDEAALVAADLLTSSVYARYYGIDYVQVRRIVEQAAAHRKKSARSSWRPWRRPVQRDQNELVSLGQWCSLAVPEGSSWSVARNGMIIERCQQVTTHNLAQLVRAGMTPQRTWNDLGYMAAVGAIDRLRRARLAGSNGKRLVKDGAYAWRQALFFATMAGPDGPARLLSNLRFGEGEWVMGEVVAGLAHIAAGGAFTDDGMCPGGRRLTGWSVGPHWVLRDNRTAGD